MEHIYIAIDLKSFYASVECVERHIDPLTSCLVVADASRTDKTICLAVSPGLKAYGVPGRPRLFEVIQKVRDINNERRYKSPGHRFIGSSIYTYELDNDPSLELEYITALPRMALYMKYSTDIYKIYLKYIAPEDIHVYSCDEVFMDVTPYLGIYSMTPHELAITMIRDVLSSTGITATAGIGTNMFLCKIAMDIVAKRMPADKDGVRIAELDMYDEALVIVMEMSDLLALDLVRKGFVTDQMTLTIGYEYLKDPAAVKAYRRELHYDWYGRPVPKHSHGTANLGYKTASASVITNALIGLYGRITDRSLLIRRVNLCACRITPEHCIIPQEEYEQLDLFTDYEARDRLRKEEAERQRKERVLQEATLEIKARYGKNAILKGTNFRPGAMTIERNTQIGGHKA